MQFSLSIPKGLLYFSAALLLCAAGPVSADSYAKQGFYIGYAKTKAGIGGDFDGQSYLTDGTEVIAIPKIKDGSGTVIQIGNRERDIAVELNYVRSTHDVTFAGAPSTADFSMWSIDGKSFFMTDSWIQPYMQLGMILTANMRMKDGASDGVITTDANYRGIFGLDYGAGVSIYPIPSVALTAGVVYRYMSFYQVRGAGEWKRYEDGLSFNGRQVNFGVAYTF